MQVAYEDFWEAAEIVRLSTEVQKDWEAGFSTGLGALDARANESHGTDFPALAEQAQVELVTQVGAEHPGFVESLLFPLYTGYYEHPRVVEALGLESRPPFPKGYPLEGGDLGLLDPVRGRTGLFREV